jgi:hypothetical protein
MKQFWAAVVIIAVAALLFFGIKSKNSVTQISVETNGTNVANTAADANNPKPSAAVENSSIGNPQSAVPNSEIAARASSPEPMPEAQNLPPATILENMRSVIRNYASNFGENPVGTNPEITAALTGNNVRQINFIPPDSGLRVNEKGELLDGYGTPFFFHQISGHEMEIRSAGPDQKMWTRDDLVTK